MWKKDYSWNLSTCICDNGKYLKNIAATLVSVCDELINTTANESRNITNAISTNATSTVSINFDDKKHTSKQNPIGALTV